MPPPNVSAPREPPTTTACAIVPLYPNELTPATSLRTSDMPFEGTHALSTRTGDASNGLSTHSCALAVPA